MPAKSQAQRAYLNAKFGHAPRDGLHKLGISDSKIQSESTEQLAEETIHALKNLVNTIE